ncbi:darcynin family protein [Brucella intermedia]|uniref:darcynin family protein n=1 Tax=Brucella intermedia TaxID=94625 RepID=UPI00224B87DA|nr:darcynin family protein [Brucella intermedia]
MSETSSQYDLATNPMTIFWLIKTTPEWLALPPHGENGRFDFGKKVLDPILARYPGAKMTFYDSEAFTADCTDVMVWTVINLEHYNGAVNDLRETRFWSFYFTIEKIIPAIENEYAKHYKTDILGQAQ